MATPDQIKRCFLFFELLDDEIERVVKDCYVERFEDGQTILKEDDLGRDFYVILSGKVRLTKIVDGREIEITVLNKGEALGETVLPNESRRMTNIIASGTVDLLIIDQDTIFALYEKHPKIFGIIMLNLSRMLTTRLQQSNVAIAKMHERFRRAG
ncbi:MAG: hypothetical protein A2151_01105 [Candidatus Muproteobacteria bacterium RBG_16_65_34]|uniref:Cyclic nucleotide-binding domain-containing protein n=1 Tax=Candidatus Muproteobacteria bacterium RBG_16_65_34 TaxID=1817760 RepID=A0A1F6TUD4_9PROT|nr:MAG: hypothetical protein A2151_01105 [Candidatus Muproteobacteria bacterium RBG_16_65_34]